jgi:competence protein ComEC
MPPLVLIAIFLATGCLLGHGFSSLPAGIAPFLPVCALGVCALGLGLLALFVARAGRLAVLLGFLVLGAGRALEAPSRGEELPRDETGLHHVTGTVTDISLRCHDDERGQGAAVERLLLVSTAPGQRIQAIASGDGSAGPVLPGDRIRLLGLLRPRASLPLLLCHDIPPVLLEPGPPSLSRCMTALRLDCARILEGELPPRHTGLLAGLLLGERGLVADRTETVLRRTGTAHLLAISGLHLGLLSLLLERALRLLALPARVRVALLVPLLFSFALFTGSRPPVLRAAIMSSLLLVGRAVSRTGCSPTALSAAAIALLLDDPGRILDAGFQLSFVAVAGLLGLAASREKKGLAARLLAAPVVAFVVTAPLSIFHFGAIAPVAPLANLVAIPLVEVALLLGGAGLSLALAGLPGAGVLLLLAETILSHTVTAMETLARIVPPLRLSGPTPVGLFLVHGLLATGLLYRDLFRPSLVLAGLLTLALSVAPAPGPESAVLRATFLDVGHGTAVLVELPGGQTLLYDCGSRSPLRRPDETVVRCLLARRLRRIDIVVVSHGDTDHLSGLDEILLSFPVGRLVTSERFGQRRGPEKALLALCRERGIERSSLARGDRLELVGPASATVLGPPAARSSPSFHLLTVPGANEDSLVLRIVCAGETLLLMGDVEGAALEKLLDAPAELPADVLLMPHHGSLEPGTEALLAAVAPQAAVISATELTDGLARLLARRGIAARCTGVSGAVDLALGEKVGEKR